MLFFHTADLHLDAGMEANMPREKANERRMELLRLFATMAQRAEEEGARAVLVAGDLFDTPCPPPSLCEQVAYAVSSHPGVDFVLLRGNHDGALPSSICALPNVRVCGDGAPIDFGGVTVRGYEDPAVDPAGVDPDPDTVNIVLLHGETAESAAPGKIDLRAWRGKGIDYLALGHYHTFSLSPLDSRGLWAYAGCPGGRGFDECDEKGYVRLETSGGKVRAEFVPLPGRQFHRVEVDVSATESVGEVMDAVRQSTSGFPAQDAVEVELVGTLPPDLPLSTAMLRDSLSERYWFVKLKDSTSCRVSAEALSYDVSLAGTFVKLVSENVSDPDMARTVISLGLAALRGEGVD